MQFAEAQLHAVSHTQRRVKSGMSCAVTPYTRLVHIEKAESARYHPLTAEELNVPRAALPRSRMSTGGRAPRLRKEVMPVKPVTRNPDE